MIRKTNRKYVFTSTMLFVAFKSAAILRGALLTLKAIMGRCFTSRKVINVFVFLTNFNLCASSRLEVFVKRAGDHAVIEALGLIGTAAEEPLEAFARGNDIHLPRAKGGKVFADRGIECFGLLFGHQSLAVRWIAEERAAAVRLFNGACIGLEDV